MPTPLRRYNDFKKYADEDAAAEYMYGMECLFRFYSYGLEKNFRGPLYKVRSVVGPAKHVPVFPSLPFCMASQ
jgi:hypothetical protein